MREKSTSVNSLLASTVMLTLPIRGVGNARWIFLVLKGRLMLQRFVVEATKAMLLVVSIPLSAISQLCAQWKRFLSVLL